MPLPLSLLLAPALALGAAVALQRHGWLNAATLTVVSAVAWTLLFTERAYATEIPVGPAVFAAAVVTLTTLPVPLIVFLGWEWYRTGRSRHQWNRWLRDIGDDDWWSI